MHCSRCSQDRSLEVIIHMPPLHHLLLLVVGLVVFDGRSSVAAVAPQDPSGDTSLGDELEAIALEIAQLKDRNQSLHQRLDDRVEQPWLDAARTAELQSLVRDVLADSSLRTSLQDTGLTVGYVVGEGFQLASSDNAFKIRVLGESQIRWVFNRSRSGQQYSNANLLVDRVSGSQTVVGSESGWGTQIRNMKLKLLGHVFDPSWQFKIELAFRSDNGEAEYEDAYINKDLGDGFSLRVGQFKAPWLREQLVSSVFQLAADRSLLDGYFNAGRSVGLQGQYRTDSLSLRGFYGNGFKTALNVGTTFTNFDNQPTEWAFAGRADWKLFGDWQELQDFNARPDQEPGMMVGFGAMGQQYNGNAEFDDPFNLTGLGDNFLFTDASLDGSTVFGVTADLTAKYKGWSFFASAVWQRFETKANGTLLGVPGIDLDLGAVNSWGAMVQGGYLLTDELELFARYTYLAPDLDSTTFSFSNIPAPFPSIPDRDLFLGNTTTNVLTLGANYFVSPELKFTLDWGMNFDRGFVGLNENTLIKRGWVPTNTSSEWNLRFQTQLLF